MKNLNDAITFLLDKIDDQTKDFLRAGNPDTVTAELHHSLGTYIRNFLDLWVLETPLIEWFNTTYGIRHADDVSSIIIKKLSYILKNNNDDSWILDDVKRYKQYWLNSGCSEDGIFKIEQEQ